MILDHPTIATYRPRQNDPLRGDMQQAFFESECEGPAFLLGGTGAGTTFTACAKMVRFLMETPPPRKDTPFWVISETYETVCKAIWKEKLSPQDGYGLMPSSEIQWERIRWYKPKEGWPFDVYLKPHPGRPGKNWVLCFKSYAQGRQNMQAESIGGFLFSEQFPWGLLNEVMGRCREYEFKGNKLLEFTPVDSSLSTELRDMEENGTLPEDWGLYRANTECALEAGHVSKQWFKQFYPMLSDQMRAVRMRGQWGGFEGAIYPEFDTAIHCIPEDYEPAHAMEHRRAIDWGFSLDHPLVCLWGARSSIGQWFIYDEYWSNDTSLSAVEHLCAIVDHRPWPSSGESAYHGTTWADHNLDCVRIASKLGQYAPGYTSFNCQLAAKSVDEGIEHVKYLLKPTLVIDPDQPPQPRLFISKRCRHLISEMRSYRRHKTTATGPNAQAAVDAPVKLKDDSCFPANAMVDTPCGAVRIVDLKRGDQVYSHLGIATVDVPAVRTGHRETVRVYLSSGHSIECTADHRLAVDAGDWVRADECLGRMVNVKDIACTRQRRSKGTPLRLSSTVDSSGEGIQPTRGRQRESTSVAATATTGRLFVESYFTSRCTATTTDPCRKASKSTTRTRTPATTIRRTSSLSLLKSTRQSTRETWQKPSLRLQLGTKAILAGSGTHSTGQRRGSIENSSQSSVLSAEESSLHETPGLQLDSAPTSADTTRGLNRGLMTSTQRVLSAAEHSARTATQRRKHARRNVRLAVAVRIERLTGTRDIFCCATSDGTLVVSGVVTMNCDALRYMLFSEAEMSGMTPSTVARQHDPSRHGIHVESSRFNRNGRR